MLSSTCLIYFSCMIFISYKQIYPNIFFGALLNFITIPFLILVPVLLVISLRKWYLEKWRIKATYCISTLILLTTIILISLASVFNI